ncbi:MULTISPECIES: MFS transporter [unclassified Francisella]|uniref:MFS transporter n=1 Tax=unclassified Francisella TaxID=2610885 RepID=UPI002E362C8A|nr:MULTISPECIES: MFS transporter [unclassified Francisella]MED7818824.1 MFS transporter [Francisella sp. 19S2-4]MED7829661.1 MFS transporter [Francisella sp. 19S2-10]
MQKLRLSLILVIGISFYCYEFFLRILTGVYQEQIVQYFNISTHIGFSFLVSSYNITYLLMQIPAGILLDRFGSKKILILATITCGVGNVIFISGGYELALLGRLLVGIGSSFAFIGVLKLTLENLNPRYFSIITSIVISLGTLAAAFSQNISVIISSYDTSWINIFIYSGLIAFPLAILFFLALPKEKYTISLMPKFDQIFEVSKKLIKNKSLWQNATWGGLLYIPTVVLTSQYGILYFKQSYGFDNIYSTTLITSIFIGWIIFSPIKSLLCNKFNGKNIINISILGVGIICILINLGIFKNSAILITLFFGMFSASQVLVWYYFNKICPKGFAAIGAALTNMIITLVIEVGQLAVGSSIDLGNIINIKANNCITTMFIVALFLAFIVLQRMLRNINNKQISKATKL